jgi:hypothetical protein
MHTHHHMNAVFEVKGTFFYLVDIDSCCLCIIHTFFQTTQCHISGYSNLDASSELSLLVAATWLYRPSYLV